MTGSFQGIVRARVMDTPDDPFHGGSLRHDAESGPFRWRKGGSSSGTPFVDVALPAPDGAGGRPRDGLVLPGLVDAHVHFPQVRVIGALGMPLLDWLDQRALPEEARLADPNMPGGSRRVRLTSAAAGTTTALVFGSHFAGAVDAFFAEADQTGYGSPADSWSGTGCCAAELYTTAERAHAKGLELAKRWHGRDGNGMRSSRGFPSLHRGELLESCAGSRGM